MLLMLEKGSTGEICHIKESLYLNYWNVNNLYG